MTEWSPGTAPTTTWEQEAGMLPSGPGVEDNISNLVERAETAATNAETAETNAETAQSGAETAQTAAEAAQTAAESAQTAAETAETNAEASATSATSSASAAASSASAASTSESNASTSETNASNSASAAASSASSASSAQTAAESARDDAEAAFDSFDDRYLGAKSSAPITDNDGDALVEGALYYDTTLTQLYVYNGSGWDPAAFNVNDAVTSFNTRTGAVTLTESDVTTALGFTPADVAGDTFTGDVSGTNLTLSGYLRGPASFVIDPATHGDDTGTLVIAGNLQVDGTTTTINSTTLDVDDLNITVAKGAADASAANGAGLTIDGASISFSYDHANTQMTLNSSLDITGTLVTDNLTVGAVSYAATDGTNGQILTTDGSGNATFEDAPESGITTGKAIAMAIVFG